MSDEFDPALLPGLCLRELRYMAGDHGYRFATHFAGQLKPIGDSLLNDRYIEPGERDGHATYEVTEAGYTWLAAQESR